MTIDKFNKVTVITADRNKFLKLKEEDHSEDLIGRPERIILNNAGKIPEFEEILLDSTFVQEESVEEKPVKKTRKTTKKK